MSLKWWIVLGGTAAIFLAVLPLFAVLAGRRALAFSDRVAAIVTRIGRAGAWLALLMMIVILYDVVTRWAKSSHWLIENVPGLVGVLRSVDPWLSSTKLQELEWHFHGALFLLCFGFAYLKDAHVRIELVRDRFGLRTRAIVEMLGILLLMLPYTLLVIDFGTGLAERSFIQNEGSSAMTGLSQRWIIKSFVPVGFVLVLLAAVSIYLKCTVLLFGPRDLGDAAGAYLAPHRSLAEEEGIEAVIEQPNPPTAP